MRWNGARDKNRPTAVGVEEPDEVLFEHFGCLLGDVVAANMYDNASCRRTAGQNWWNLLESFFWQARKLEVVRATRWGSEAQLNPSRVKSLPVYPDWTHQCFEEGPMSTIRLVNQEDGAGGNLWWILLVAERLWGARTGASLQSQALRPKTESPGYWIILQLDVMGCWWAYGFAWQRYSWDTVGEELHWQGSLSWHQG